MLEQVRLSLRSLRLCAGLKALRDEQQAPFTGVDIGQESLKPPGQITGLILATFASFAT